MTEVSDLLGMTMTKITKFENDELWFYEESGRIFHMVHGQDCCESVHLEDVCGDLEDLVGTPLLQAEEVTNDNGEWDDKPLVSVIKLEAFLRGWEFEAYESATWTFYKFATVKGYVTLRWIGTSNGYYSESVSLYEIEEKNDEELYRLGISTDRRS